MEVGISGRSSKLKEEEISNDNTRPLKIDPKDLQPSSDGNLLKKGLRWITGRHPKASVFCVSDTSREIIKRSYSLLKCIYSSTSSSTDLQILDNSARLEIYKLISTAASLHDDALKLSDGGSGKGDSFARGNVRDTFQDIANRLKAWQDFVENKGSRPEKMEEAYERVDKASITKETYLNALGLPEDLSSRLARGPVFHITESGKLIQPENRSFRPTKGNIQKFENRRLQLIQQQGWEKDYYLLFKTEVYPESNCYSFAYTNCEGGCISTQDAERILKERYGNEPIMVGKITGKGTGRFDKAGSKKSPVPGDLCVFRDKRGNLNHIAVYTFRYSHPIWWTEVLLTL